MSVSISPLGYRQFTKNMLHTTKIWTLFEPHLYLLSFHIRSHFTRCLTLFSCDKFFNKMEKKPTVETIPELNIEIVERRKIRTPLHTNT